MKSHKGRQQLTLGDLVEVASKLNNGNDRATALFVSDLIHRGVVRVGRRARRHHR